MGIIKGFSSIAVFPVQGEISIQQTSEDGIPQTITLPIDRADELAAAIKATKRELIDAAKQAPADSAG